ncbi:MAG: FAD-binding protein, partial [Oscillospiraceae bacterium]|nr:FAD-binding protein [Oscillospiraceae bacterium]
MTRYDLIVVGAGPAGLSAAAEAASNGLKVAVFDENA